MNTETIEISQDLTSAPDQISKRRRIAFRVVATLVALFILAQQIFGLMEIVLMWLPVDTLSSVFDDDFAEIASHRAHFMVTGILAWSIVLSLLVQLRKPENRGAPMLLVVGMALAATFVYGLSGTLSEWLLEEIVLVVIPIFLVVFLHPSRSVLFTRPRFDRSLAAMAALVTAPWLIYIVHNASLQLAYAGGDTHAEMEHWATAAQLGITLIVAAFLASSDHTGWRLTGWIAVGGSTIFGMHSLVFPGLASALAPVWAVAAILWGLAFGAMLIGRSWTDRTAIPTK